MTAPLAYVGSREPWYSREVSSNTQCVLAPNPSVMTLDGTNTWILSAPGSSHGLVIDPGPRDPAHLDAIEEVLRARGVSHAQILLTHGHNDHSEGAVDLAGRLGSGVRALDPAHRLGGEGLGPGDVVAAGDIEVRVVATPGHTSDSLSFHLLNDAALLTGDTVLGRGTTVVAHPDGRLVDYLASLDRLRRLAEDARCDNVYPGHGPALSDPVDLLDTYIEHRRQRLDQVRNAIAEGAATPAAVVATVYVDVPREVWPAAELSVRAQWEYLIEGR